MKDLQECLDWCMENGATVSFLNVYGHCRVEVRVGGHAAAERDTLVEAVAAAAITVSRERRARGVGQ